MHVLGGWCWNCEPWKGMCAKALQRPDKHLHACAFAKGVRRVRAPTLLLSLEMQQPVPQ